MTVLYETMLLWFGLSFLYMGTGIVIQVLWGDELPWGVSFTFLALGAAIFLAVNRTPFAHSEFLLFVWESLILFLLFVGWAFGVATVYEHVRLRHSLSDLDFRV